MKVKDSYSLCIEELLGEMEPAENLPTNFDGGIEIQRLQTDYSDSLNIFQAFADYLVERNRTQDMRKQIAAAEDALDARNAEAQRQSEIIVEEYSKRLNNFVTAKRQEFDLELRRMELESAEIVEQIRQNRERQRLKIITEMLGFHRTTQEEMQDFLKEIESSPEKFMTKNRFYFQVKEDCRIKMKRIKDLLKKIDREEV